MDNSLVLVKSATFNGLTLDCYLEQNNNHESSKEFWATREQIGALLEYENPEISIANIHNRHSDRLDTFSTLTKLIRVEGNREVAREVTVYSFKGLLEICRFSNQPKANAVMDFLWNVADEINKTGSYGTRHAHDTFAVDAAIRIFELAGITGNQLILAADKVYKRCTGFSALLAGDVQLEAPVKEQALTPSQIAEALGIGKGKKGARKVNNMLEIFGFQRKIGDNWKPLEKGREYAVVLDAGKLHSDGTPIRQIKWNSSIINVIQEELPFC